jgi:hypothetical protein
MEKNYPLFKINNFGSVFNTKMGIQNIVCKCKGLTAFYLLIIVFLSGCSNTNHPNSESLNAKSNGSHSQSGETIKATNVVMSSAGVNSSAIATDRGGGTITVKGVNISTSGPDSPGIYSTGTISVSDATISATGSEAAVIEGPNSIVLSNTSLTTSKENKWGILMYQSMSGGATGATSTFTQTNGNLSNTASTGPLFYVTNANGIINLNAVNVKVISGTLLKAAAGKWGIKGSNGGTAKLTANRQTLRGSLIADKYSSITLTLQNNSILTGSINNANTAGIIELTLDATSKWNVTEDSYINTLSDASGISGNSIINIYGNGFNVYYNPGLPENKYLDRKIYKLNGGGYLAPKES